MFFFRIAFIIVYLTSRGRERGRNPSDRTRSGSHLLHLNCRVCPLELSLSLPSTVNQGTTPSLGNALTVRTSHLWLSPKWYSTIFFTLVYYLQSLPFPHLRKKRVGRREKTQTLADSQSLLSLCPPPVYLFLTQSSVRKCYCSTVNSYPGVNSSSTSSHRSPRDSRTITPSANSTVSINNVLFCLFHLSE